MDYAEYESVFNTGDDAALVERFFADDCVMESASGTRVGKSELLAFLDWAHDGVREVVRPQSVLQDGNRIFAEIDMDFHASKDRPEFPLRPLKAGDSLTVKFFGLYLLDEEGRIARLKTMYWPAGKGVTTLPPLGPHPSQIAAYSAYTAAFSAGDAERFTRFYTEDVELRLPAVPVIRGRDAIASFYSTMFERVRETLTIHSIEAGETQIVADTTSRFTAIADAPDFVVGSLQEGNYIDVRVVVTYALRDGLIADISVQRAGEPMLVRAAR